MKKILCFAVIALFAMSGAAFAWSVTSSGANDTTGTCDARASNNVTIQVNSLGGQSYAASAGHTSGDKAFGVASNSSIVKYKSKTKGTAWGTTFEPGTSGADAFANGWSDM